MRILRSAKENTISKPLYPLILRLICARTVQTSWEPQSFKTFKKCEKGIGNGSFSGTYQEYLQDILNLVLLVGLILVAFL